MVTAAEDLALRNEQQAAYQQKSARAAARTVRTAARADEELPEFDAEAAEAMRAAARKHGRKDPEEEVHDRRLDQDGEPERAAETTPQDVPARRMAPKPELTQREREEFDRQRRAAAYAKKHAAGQTDEAKADLERLRPRKREGRPPRPLGRKRRKRKHARKPSPRPRWR